MNRLATLGIQVAFYRDQQTPSDAPLLARCLRENWGISGEQRQRVLNSLVAIATDEGDPKNAVKAAKALVDADANDLRAVSIVVAAGLLKEQQSKLEQARVPVSAIVTDDDLREGLQRLVAPAIDAVVPERSSPRLALDLEDVA